LIVSDVGAAVYFAGNTWLPMFVLCRQHAAATIDAQRAAIVAAGQPLLAVGKATLPALLKSYLMKPVHGRGDR